METFRRVIAFIIRVMSKENVFLSYERVDAEITARDNARIEIIKQALADKGE